MKALKSGLACNTSHILRFSSIVLPARAHDARPALCKMARILPRNDPLRWQNHPRADIRANHAASPPTYRAQARLLRGACPPRRSRARRTRMADANGFDLLNCQRTIAAVWRDHFARAIMNYEF
jgi:hypothetical protein